MKKSLAPFAVVALLLAGCSATPGNAEAPEVEPANQSKQAQAAETESPAAETPEEPAEGETSSRGNLIKAVGEGAGVTDDGVEVASFVINSITVDDKCTSEYASKPDNGHFVFLDVSMKTQPELAESVNPSFGLAGFGWKAIAPNGTTSNADAFSGASFMCLDDSDQLPSSLGPGEQATGLVVLDVENPEGVLVYKPGFAPVGWEWEYSAD